MDDPRFLREEHPFIGADSIFLTSPQRSLLQERDVSRSANAIYNWEMNVNIITDVNQVVCSDPITADRMWAFQNLARNDQAANYNQLNSYATNFDAFYKNGVTHLVCQEIAYDGSSNGIISSKIFYSRWNGNLGSGAYWTPPIQVSPPSSQLLHVTPAVAANDFGDVIVVWNIHDDPGISDNNVFQRPDDIDPNEDQHWFTYSWPNSHGNKVYLHAAILSANSNQFENVSITDTIDDQIYDAYGAYPDLTDFHFKLSSNLEASGFLLVYEDREQLPDEEIFDAGYFVKARVISSINGDYIALPNHVVNTNQNPGFFPCIAADQEFIYITWFQAQSFEGLQTPLYPVERIARVTRLDLNNNDSYWTDIFDLSPNITLPLDRVLRHPGLSVDGRGRHAISWAGFAEEGSIQNQVWAQIYDNGWWGGPVIKAPNPNHYGIANVDIDSYIHRHYRDVLLAEDIGTDPNGHDICELCCEFYFGGGDFGEVRQRWPINVEFRDPDVALDSVGGVNVNYTIMFELGGPNNFSIEHCNCGINWPPTTTYADPVWAEDPTVPGDYFYESDCAYWNGSGWTVRDVFYTDAFPQEIVSDSFARPFMLDRGVFINQGLSGGFDRSPGGGYPLGLQGQVAEEGAVLPKSLTPPTEHGLAAAPIIRVVHDNITPIIGSFSHYNGSLSTNPNNWHMNTTYFENPLFNYVSEVPFNIWLPNEDRVDFDTDAEWVSAVFSDPVNLGNGVGPDVACDQIGNTYVVYSMKEDEIAPWHIYVRRRTPDGSWTDPTDVSGANSVLNDELPAMDISPVDGSIHLAWQRRNPGASGDGINVAYDIFYAVSKDNGRSWSSNNVTTNSTSYNGDCDISIDRESDVHVVWVQMQSGNLLGSKIMHANLLSDWTIDTISLESGSNSNYPSIMPQIASYRGSGPYTVVVWAQWGPKPEDDDQEDPYRYHIARKLVGETDDPIPYAWDDLDFSNGAIAGNHFLSPNVFIDQSTGVEYLTYFGTRSSEPKLTNEFSNMRIAGLGCGRSRQDNSNYVDRDSTYWVDNSFFQDGNIATYFPNCTQNTEYAFDNTLFTFSPIPANFIFPVLAVDSNGIPQVSWYWWQHHGMEPVQPGGTAPNDHSVYVTVFDDLESFYFGWNEIPAEQDSDEVGFYDPYRLNDRGDCGVSLTAFDPDHSLGGPLMGVHTPINNSAIACDSHNRVHLTFVSDPSFATAESGLGPDLPDTNDFPVFSPIIHSLNTGDIAGDFHAYIFFQYDTGSESPDLWYLQKTFTDSGW